MSHQPDSQDLVSVLVEDHREVEAAFARFDALPPGDPRRRQVADEAIAELVRHSVAEEMYLYPTTRRALPDGDDLADHEIDEHATAERTMKQVEGVDVTDPRFDQLMAALMQEVRGHIEEEERDLFPRLQAALGAGELVELGGKVQQAKRLAPTRPHPSAPDRPPLNKVLAPGTGLVDRLRDALTGRGQPG